MNVTKKNDVAIIICVYNPDWPKLLLTVLSAIKQQEVVHEIIICDDGSENNFFSKLKLIFSKYNFTNYRFIGSDANEGTVKNCYKGLLAANSKYIYTISPGDFFYDELTIKKMITFTKENSALVCFGNVIYYSNIDEFKKIHLVNDIYNVPHYPYIYDRNYSLYKRKVAFLAGGAFHGAAVLSEYKCMKYYIEKIVDKVKYCEDYGTVLLQLYDNIYFCYFKEYVVWYEYGSGISTNKNDKWSRILRKDREETIDLLCNKFTHDITIKCAKILNKKDSKLFIAIMLLFTSPVFSYYYLLFKMRCLEYANIKPIKYDYCNLLLGEIDLCK